MDPVTALRQIAYYKDRAREDSRRVMAYRNAADIVERSTDAQREKHGTGQQLAVAARRRAQDREGDRAGVGGPRARRARRIAFDSAADLGGGEIRAALQGRPARALELVRRLGADRGDDGRRARRSATSTAR